MRETRVFPTLVRWGYEDGPFDESLSKLRIERYDITSASDFAEALVAMLPNNDPRSGRKQVTVNNDDLTKNGTWVAENAIYCANCDILITDRDHSPLLKYAKEATEISRNAENSNKKEFYLPKNEFEKIYQLAKRDPDDAIRSGVLKLRRAEYVERSIKADEFEENPATRFLFRDSAKSLGELLVRNGVSTIRFHAVTPQYIRKNLRPPFCRSIWINPMRLSFSISAQGGDLHAPEFSKESTWPRQEYRMYGIRYEPAEGITHHGLSDSKEEFLYILEEVKRGHIFMYTPDDGKTLLYIPRTKSEIEAEEEAKKTKPARHSEKLGGNKTKPGSSEDVEIDWAG